MRGIRKAPTSPKAPWYGGQGTEKANEFLVEQEDIEDIELEGSTFYCWFTNNCRKYIGTIAGVEECGEMGSAPLEHRQLEICRVIW